MPGNSSHTSASCASDFLRAKIDRRKLSMVTCYDYTFARLLGQSAIDGILVGDSAAMVMHGHSSTLSVNVELMRLHTEAVVRGAPDKFIVAENVTTQKGARTLALDSKTHNVFVVTAKFGPPPAATADNPHPRRTILPDSFVVLVVGR